MNPTIQPIRKHRARGDKPKHLILVVLLAGLVPLIFTSSAGAVTFGLGWTGYSEAENEMNHVRHAGAENFRIPIDRARCWSENWDPCDRFVKAAWEQGVTITPYLVWTRSGETRFLLPEEFEAGNWGAWSREVVERYGVNGDFWSGKANPKPVNDWEVWNEPNLKQNNPRLGTEEKIQPQNYGKFLKFTAEKIQEGSVKKTAHGTGVLFGGLYMPGGQYYNSFLENAAEVTGVANSYTAVSIHPYSFYSTATTSKIDEMAREIEDVRYVLNNRISGGAGKGLWITEFGWHVKNGTDPNEPPAVSDQQQADLLRESIDWIKSHAGANNIQTATWYNIRDGGLTNWGAYCGLRARDGSYRLAWWAFQEETGRPRWPVAPAVETNAATQVLGTKATFSAWINPHDLPTSYRFEWGTTTAYGNSVPIPNGSAGTGEASVWVSATPANLQPGTTYHYRVVATNDFGTSFGPDRSFTTRGTTPAIVIDKSGVEHMFTRSPGGRLEEWFQIGTRWSKRLWGSGGMAGAPAAFVAADGTIWVYYRNIDNKLTQWKFQGANWSAEDIGISNMAGNPAAFQGAEGWRWVYYRNTDNKLTGWKFRGPGEYAAEDIGVSNMAGDPAAFEDAEGWRWVYYRNTSNQLTSWKFKGTSWKTESVISSMAGDPAAFQGAEGWRWVYFRNTSNQLTSWKLRAPSEFASENIGGYAMDGEPAAIGLPSGERHVFYLNTDGQPYRWWLQGTSWAHDALPSKPPFAGSVSWGGPWSAAYTSPLAFADANGDGKADILGRNTTNMDRQVGLSSGSFFSPSTSWGL